MNNVPQWVAKAGSRCPLIITHGVTFFCYLGYLFTYLLPCLLNKQLFYVGEVSEQQGYLNQKRIYPLFIVIHILFLMYLIAFYRTIFTHPGTVPQSWRDQIEREIEDYFKQEKQIIDNWRDEQRNTRPSNIPQNIEAPRNEEETSEVNFEDPEQRNDTMDQTLRLRLNIQAKIELLDKRGRRFCKRCQCMKPSRTHHCSQCQECLLKMDHHCSFVNNCVGFKNYKYFLNMLFYACNLLIIILYTYTPMFKKAMKNPDIPDQYLFFIALYYELTWILGIILIGFSLFHIILLAQNKTTLEYLENKADAARGDYDLGLTGNVDSVLGGNCLIWCLPAFPNLKGDGVNYMREQSNDA